MLAGLSRGLIVEFLSKKSCLPVQLCPSPANPLLHVQLKEPLVFLQVASSWQVWLPVVHSSISVQLTPSPSYPELHVQLYEPILFVQNASSWQSSLFVRHSSTSKRNISNSWNISSLKSFHEEILKDVPYKLLCCAKTVLLEYNLLPNWTNNGPTSSSRILKPYLFQGLASHNLLKFMNSTSANYPSWVKFFTFWLKFRVNAMFLTDSLERLTLVFTLSFSLHLEQAPTFYWLMTINLVQLSYWSSYVGLNTL